jgi:hypothetical protein
MWCSLKAVDHNRQCAFAGPNFPAQKCASQGRPDQFMTPCGCGEVRRLADQILGRFETDTGITRDASGKIIDCGSNQLLRLPK